MRQSTKVGNYLYLNRLSYTKTYTLIRPVGAAANTVPGALVVGAAGGIIDYVDVTNGIITWSFDPATSTLTLRDNRPVGVAAAPLAAALVRGGESAVSAKEVADSITNAVPGSDGSNVGRGINEMPLELQAAAINDELPIVTTGENIAAVNLAVAEVITAAVSGNVAAISARMGDIASPVSSSFGAPSFDGGGTVSPDVGGSTSQWIINKYQQK